MTWLRGTLAKTALAAVLLVAGRPVAQAQIRGNFADADMNHDGHITLPEFDAYVANRLMSANGPLARRFRQLSPNQQAARLQQRFQKLDRAHKGYLDENDWSSR